MRNSPETTPARLSEWADDIKRTVRLTRETIDASREAMAEADRILAGQGMPQPPTAHGRDR